MSLRTSLSSSKIEAPDDDFINSNQPVSQSFLSTASSYKKLLKVVYMGLGFLLLFTGVMSGSYLMTQIYIEFAYTSLQKWTTLIFSIVFLVSLFIMPSIIKHWTYKFGVFIGSIGYLFTLLPGLMTASYKPHNNDFWSTTSSLSLVSIICAVINGLTAPILWLSANRYVTGCTNENNKGIYLGLFSSFFVGAQVISSMLSAFVIKSVGHLGFCLATIGLVIAAIVIFHFAPNVDKYDGEATTESVSTKAKKIMDLAIGPRMRLFMPYCLCVGLLLAVYPSFESQIVDNAISDYSTTEQEEAMSLILISQNVAGLFACYSAGFLADIIPLKLVLSIFIGFSSAGIVVGYFSFIRDPLPLCYFMSGLFAKGSSGSLVLVTIVMAKDFEGTVEAFASSQALSTLGTIIGMGLSLVLKDHVAALLSVMLLFLILNQISVLFYRSLPKKVTLEQPRVENVELMFEL